MKRMLKVSVVFLLVIAMLLSLTGCSNTQKAEAAVKNMFQALQNMNFEKAESYMDTDDLDLDELDDDDDTAGLNAVVKAFFERLDYKIVSSEQVDDETVHVVTEVTTANLTPVLADFMLAAMQYSLSNAFADPEPTDEEVQQKMEELFEESLAKVELKTNTNEVTITVVKNGDDWKVASDDILADALMGGLGSALDSLSDSFK